MTEPLTKTYLSRAEVDLLAKGLAALLLPDVSGINDAHDAARAIFFASRPITEVHTEQELAVYSMVTHLAELRGDLTLEKERRDREAEWAQDVQARQDPSRSNPG